VDVSVSVSVVIIAARRFVVAGVRVVARGTRADARTAGVARIAGGARRDASRRVVASSAAAVSPARPGVSVTPGCFDRSVAAFQRGDGRPRETATRARDAPRRARRERRAPRSIARGRRLDRVARRDDVERRR
jgi:hypothetical protein